MHFTTSLIVHLALLSAAVAFAQTDRIDDDLRPTAAIFRGDDLVVAGADNELRIIRDDREIGRAKVAPGIVRMRRIGAEISALSSGEMSFLFVLDAATLSVKRRIACGPFVSDFAVTGDRVIVCHPQGDLLRGIAIKNGDEIWRTTVAREPNRLLAGPDGREVWVATHLPEEAATAAITSCGVLRIDPRDGTILDRIDLPDGATGLKDLILSSDGSRLYFGFILAKHRLPATQLSRGWVTTNALGIVDRAAKKIEAVLLLDDIDRGAANPWGLAVSNGTLAVSLGGAGECMLIDEARMLAKIRDVPADDRHRLATRLSFLADSSVRIPLAIEGPREIVPHREGWAALGYFSNSVQFLTIDGRSSSVVALGRPAQSAARLGEALFHDARPGFQTWQSCASCHPNGRVDGLAWDRPYDFGHSRKTKSLVGATKTPPSSITGIRANARAASRAAFEFSGCVPSEAELDRIDAYLDALRPTPSPHLEPDGRLNPLAKVGRDLFGSARCIECHGGEHFTSLTKKDIGTGRGDEEGRRYDIPSLVEVRRNAPYLHDGRAADLESIWKIHDPSGRHGDARTLGDADFQALMEYLRSL